MDTCTKEDNWVKKMVLPDETREFIDLTPAMTPEEIEAAIAETPCPKDSDTAMRVAASLMGKKGGSRKSPAKTRANSANGKKGGWPKGRPRRTAGGESQTGTTWPVKGEK